MYNLNVLLAVLSYGSGSRRNNLAVTLNVRQSNQTPVNIEQ